jgi:DNA-binding transcriptional MocR family regulator
MTMWRPRLEGRGGPRYLAIVEALAEELAAGALQQGTRLPTHRELAERLGVTVGTVSRAYSEAARRGLVSGEVGRGTFVRGAPLEEEAGGAVVDLAQNHPPDPAGHPQRAALLAALASLTARADAGRLLDYPAAGGNAADREAGAAWVSRAGVEASPGDVLVCTGSQHGLTVVLATLLEPGDLLLTEALTYTGVTAVAGLLHLRLRGLPVDAHGLRPDALEEACREGGAKALYLIPTHHNPTTAVMPAGAAARSWIGRPRPRPRHRGGRRARPAPRGASPAPGRPRPRAHVLPHQHVEDAGPGPAHRLRGSPPRPWWPASRPALRATTWAVAPLTAAVASAVDRRRHRRRAPRRAARGGPRAAGGRRLSLAGADVLTRPEAYYLWLRLPEPWRGDAFAAEARARGVLVTPAEAFAVGRAPAPHAVRLCLGAARSRDALARGLGVVAELLRAGETTGAVVV